LYFPSSHHNELSKLIRSRLMRWKLRRSFGGYQQRGIKFSKLDKIQTVTDRINICEIFGKYVKYFHIKVLQKRSYYGYQKRILSAGLVQNSSLRFKKSSKLANCF
jgi:hypothetical protein